MKQEKKIKKPEITTPAIQLTKRRNMVVGRPHCGPSMHAASALPPARSVRRAGIGRLRRCAGNHRRDVWVRTFRPEEFRPPLPSLGKLEAHRDEGLPCSLSSRPNAKRGLRGLRAVVPCRKGRGCMQEWSGSRPEAKSGCTSSWAYSATLKRA